MATFNIFISYRSVDTAPFKEQLVKFLEKHFPNVTVRSSSDIGSGADWLRELYGFIDSSRIMIVLAGAKWEHGDGTKDIKNNEKDVVRLEVLHGLQRRDRGLLIITILVNRLKLNKELLPEQLHPLLSLHWRKAHTRDIRSDLLKVTADIYKELDHYRPKPVVLISSTLAFLGDGVSTEGLDYFTTLVMTVIQRLKSRGCDVILKVPIYAEGKSAAPDAAENQRGLLEETLQHSGDYSGVIIAPFDLSCLRDAIRKLLRVDPNYPIATIDKFYDPNDPYFVEDEIQPPAGFVCDGHFNGRLAADCVLRYFERATIKRPNVVIVQGLQGSGERIAGFLSRIREHNDGKVAANYVNVYVSERTDFIARDGARRARLFSLEHSSWDHLVDQEYSAVIKNEKRNASLSVSAFFCCNDELALGVREYLEERRIEGKLEATVVVGFDGISTARLLIMRKDPWLLNSVDVRVSEQVSQLTWSFVEAMEKKTSVKPVDPVKGYLVDKNYDDHIDEILRIRRSREPEMRHAPSNKNSH